MPLNEKIVPLVLPAYLRRRQSLCVPVFVLSRGLPSPSVVETTNLLRWLGRTSETSKVRLVPSPLRGRVVPTKGLRTGLTKKFVLGLGEEECPSLEGRPQRPVGVFIRCLKTKDRPYLTVSPSRPAV